MSKLIRQFKYPEVPKIERELDFIIKFLNDNNITISTLQEIVKKIQQQGSGAGITIVGSKNPPTNADKFIFQDSSQSFNYVTITWQQLKAIIDDKKGLVGTKEVDETNIGNDKILVFNSTQNKLLYEPKQREYPFTLPEISDFTISRTDSNFIVTGFSKSLGCISLRGYKVGGSVESLAFRGMPVSPPFTLIARINTYTDTLYHRGGIVLSDGTRFILVGTNTQLSATNPRLPEIMFFNSLNSYNSTPYYHTENNHPYGALYFRITDNGTNLNIDWSISGTNWLNIYTASRTAFLPSGASEIGIGLEGYTNTTPRQSEIALTHWSLT